MTTCPECESAVAETEQFCPICGISLTPVVSTPVVAETPEPAVDDSLESTMMVSPEELERLVSEVGRAGQQQAETGPDENITSDSVDVRSTAEYSRGISQTNEQINFAPSSTDPSAPNLESSAGITESSGAENLSSADTGSPIRSVDEISGVPEAPVALAEPSAAAETSMGEPAPSFEDTPLAAIPVDSDDIPVIAKPDVELPEHDSSVPIYDSVRIVSSELEQQDYIATRIPSHPIVEATPEPTPPAIIDPQPRQQTTPNIGNESTGGRLGSKLKPLSEGTVLNGRYEIIRKIGGGGMGAVYLASDNNLGGVLRAVKEMVQAHIEEDQQEKAINDFKRESMILSSLDHSSIPTIFDYFYDAVESRFYLVMKYISGGDLAARLRAAPEGKIDELTVTDWAVQIADVLHYLHSQPSTIVYRDLKPSNIMLDSSGRIMLIDFGIARSISHKEQKGVTAVGTMGYAPPELFSGNVEPRSDIYSLGSTMFHLLTGADPQSNPLLIFDFQKNPRPRQINPRLSDQMEKILMRAVEYNADARFASAAEMRAALEQHAASLRSGNVTYGVGEAPASVSLANQTVFCGFCGQRIVATDLFCAFCGAKQPLAQQGVQSQIYAKPVATARLVIEGTTELAAPAFALQKEQNLVGRRDPMSNIFPEVDLSKYDPQTKISRRHARIWRDGGRFLVEDLGSSNGTLISTASVDSMRLIPHKPHPLSSGDRIKVGDTTLHFVLE